MLFNSPEFLLLFLPATLVGFILVGRQKYLAIAWLAGTSAFFYGYWSIRYLLVLLALMVTNYHLGRLLYTEPSRKLLAAGIAINLGVLGYFKYFNFFVESFAGLSGVSIALSAVILPLGISFFTFQKIAYLVDSHRRQLPPHSFLEYALFVLFFPQLIAGPIVHAREIIPQLGHLRASPRLQNVAIGLTIFVIGLSKKMLIADHVALIATPVFDGAAAGEQPHFFAAWAAALAYALQIYFDFSGYSDMAIGLARMFGIVLPINFASPYKAASIAEFWRCWHITLSRFLRNYLYIPLGGNRRGRTREYANLLLTMTLGGLWHGAGWTFLLWGFLHGLLLAVHRLWQRGTGIRLPHVAGRILTFGAVLWLWVPFRAESLEAAAAVWSGMLGLNGVALPRSMVALLGASGFDGVGIRVASFGMDPKVALFWMPLALAIALIAPNTQTILRDWKPGLGVDGRTASGIDDASSLRWRPALRLGAALGILLGLCMLRFNDFSEFIYFQF